MPRRERGQTPAGFRRQLLQRLRNLALRDGIPAQRLQQQVAFERLLARLPIDGQWVLKGGFALQFRYGLRTRPTRDMDLRADRELNEALTSLRQTLSTATIPDGFSFELGEIAREMQGAPGGSLRIRVVTRLAGSDFAMFHLDISSGDAMVDTANLIRGSDLLEFAGIEPIRFPVYPVEQHLAEKLHAYSLPRAQENTRVKDLVDLVIFVTTEQVQADRLQAAVEATFIARGTHRIPERLPEPPDSWAHSFATIASGVAATPTVDLQTGYQLACKFWNSLLSGDASHKTWSPDEHQWSRAQ